MAKYKSIQNTLGKKFIFALVVPFFVVILISVIFMAIYMVNELERDHQDLMTYAGEVFTYEDETASQELIDELNAVESGYIAKSDIESYLNGRLKRHTLLRDMLVLNPYGIVEFTTNGNGAIKGFDYSRHTSFMNASTDEVVWSPVVLSQDSGEITIDVSYKSKAGNVIIAKFAPKEFQSIVDEMAKGNNREVAITTDDGVYVAHSDISYVLNRSRELHMDQYLEHENDAMTMHHVGELMIITIKKVGNHGLYMVTYTDFMEYYRPLFLLAAVSFILVLLSTYFTIRYLRKHARNIVHSVNKLVDLTGEVSEGNYGFQLESNTYVELEKLTIHFNEMSKVIEDNFNELSDNSVELEMLNEDLMLQNIKIRENEEQIERILDSTYDGILLVNTKGKILRANATVWELFEVPSECVESKRYCKDLFKHVPEVCIDSSNDVVSRTGFDRHRLIEFRGKLIEEVTSALYEAGGMVGHIKTYRDITPRIELEKKVNRATKMEAIGRLTSGIAHDFNNILQVIVGYSELVFYQLDKEDTDENLLKKVNLISDAALKAEKLIRKLMTFSRMDQSSKVSIDINECVEDISQMLARIIGENIELELDLDQEIKNVMADKTQIEQIIVNLCVNSKDAIEDHGMIKIKTYETLRRGGGFICIEVSDTGNGMTSEVKDKIFEPFFTTKGIGKGTGLGLATVLGIVESHGGIIELDSELALGTTFKIILPNEQIKILTKETVAEEEKRVDFSSLKVMLIDEDRTLLGIHRIMLEAVGVEVAIASSFQDAEEQIRANRSRYDLVIVDINHDQASQVEFKKKMTSGEISMDVVIASESKELSHTHKPYRNKELIKLITNVVYS